MLSKGHEYERRAAAYLNERGLQILHQNFRCKLGEIDIIARDEQQLVFIEVKFRKNDRFGNAAEHVHFSKQQKLRRTAEYYLVQYAKPVPCRFDVLAFTGNQAPNWIKNAF